MDSKLLITDMVENHGCLEASPKYNENRQRESLLATSLITKLLFNWLLSNEKIERISFKSLLDLIIVHAC